MKTEEARERAVPEQKEIPGVQAGHLQEKAAGAVQVPEQEDRLITEILPPEEEKAAGAAAGILDI